MTIPKSLQLIAGRTAQEFNIRKKRKGAFWEDRYHATAIQTDEHLAKCMVYIDLNMVRAGVVKHPNEYNLCGYSEIQNPPERYSIIDRKVLLRFFAFVDEDCLRQEHRAWVETELKDTPLQSRNPLWSESIAVGTEPFLTDMHEKLAGRAQGRSVVFSNEKENSIVSLKEPQSPYSTLCGNKNELLSLNNTYLLRMIN